MSSTPEDSLSISGRRLADLRAVHDGIGTNQALAEALELHPSTVSRAVNGRSQPGWKFLRALRRTFGEVWAFELVGLNGIGDTTEATVRLFDEIVSDYDRV